MSSNKCSNLNCKEQKYLKEDKCIFHCDKTKENGWILSSNKVSDLHLHECKKNIWHIEKVQEFWKQFNLSVSKQNIFESYKFPIYWEYYYKHESILNETTLQIKFQDCIF